jgi:NADPH:quinone reductase
MRPGDGNRLLAAACDRYDRGGSVGNESALRSNEMAGTMDSPAAAMRAWHSRTVGIAGLALADIPRPKPSRSEILVRVEAAALNFSDLLMIDDRYQIRPERPFVPGQEIAGTVIAADDDTGFAVGERVASKVITGGLAEFALVRSDMGLRAPAGFSTEAAATLPVAYTTAIVALTECTTVASGETVLVLAAAGGVGLAAVEVARHLGARVIAAAGGEDKCQLARMHGAHEAIDYRDAAWPDLVRRLTDQAGVDIIVDPIGGAYSAAALRLMNWGARLLVVGFSTGEIPQIPANRLLLRRASAIGVYWSHERDGPMLARVTRRLSELAQSGAIRPHVGAVYAFEDLPQALAALAARATTGKVIVRVAKERGR